jgi:hypothetical protein
MLCAPRDRSGRSAWLKVVLGFTPDSIPQKYAQTVTSTWTTPVRCSFLGDERPFHTAWTLSGS